VTVGANNWMPLAADRLNVTSTGIALGFQYCDQLMVMWSIMFDPTADVAFMRFNQDLIGTTTWSRTISVGAGSTTITNVSTPSATALVLTGTATVNTTQQGVIFINNRETSTLERMSTFYTSHFGAYAAQTVSFGAGARVQANVPITGLSLGGQGNNAIRTGSAKLAVFGSNII